MTDVLGKVTDVNQTLVYGGQKMGKKFLRLGLLSLVVCGAWLWLGPDNALHGMIAGIGVALGLALAIYGGVKWLAPPTPALVISPKGIRQYLDFVKTIDIPWHEVRGVDSIDISGHVGRDFHHLTDVTVVLVTRFLRRAHPCELVVRARPGLAHALRTQGRHGAGRAASPDGGGKRGRTARGGGMALEGLPR